MKKIEPARLGLMLLTFITLSFGDCQGQGPIRISEDLTCTPLQNDVFLVRHFYPEFGSNSLFVALPGRKGVLVDTPTESTGTRALLGWIDSTFGKLELVAINTGWHQDNLGGNEVLRSRGIDVYGPDLTARMITEHAEELKSIMLESTRGLEDQRYYESYRELKLVPPNKTFPIQDGLKLEFGDEVFEVFFPGESHTVDNTVVYLHKRQVLFGGCMVLSMRHRRPGFIKYANMTQWPLSIQKVINKFPSARIVVPGHGPPGNSELLSHTIEVLNRFNAENPR